MAWCLKEEEGFFPWITMKKTQRLDKILAHTGHGTRREIKDLVKRGAVSVNGQRVKDSGLQVDPDNDDIRMNGEAVVYREYVYWMLHKPDGVISATEDTRDRTVLDLLKPKDRAPDLFPVGRLDKDTEGLLLLTNDGKLAHNLLSPKKHVPKTYYAEIDGMVDENDAEAFRQGVTLDDGYKTLPADLHIIHAADGASTIELTIREGKFHQVKRMFLAVGKKVTYLKRISMGPLKLDPTLPKGQYRELTTTEREGLIEFHEL